MELPPITSSQNRQIGLVRRYLARPKECRREGLLVADGIHLAQEGLEAGLACRALFITTDERDPEIVALLKAAASRRLPVYRVLPHIFRRISPVETPQGVVGVFHRPRFEKARIWGAPPAARGLLAVAHGVQDPANIGSLARSALAAGVRALLTTPATVDPFHHRALRASMGAAFRLPILTDEPVAPLVSRLKNLGYLTAGLTGRGETRLPELDPRRPTALFFGSEGSGLDAASLAEMDVRVRIPIRPEVESLGVAAAAAVAFFWLHLASRNGDLPH